MANDLAFNRSKPTFAFTTGSVLAFNRSKLSVTFITGSKLAFTRGKLIYDVSPHTSDLAFTRSKPTFNFSGGGANLSFNAKKASFSFISTWPRTSSLEIERPKPLFEFTSSEGTLSALAFERSKPTFSFIGGDNTNGTLAFNAKKAIFKFTTALVFSDCIVMNIENLADSIYTNYNFKGFLQIEDQVIGITSGGLYLLTGDDDAGSDIEAILETVQNKLGGLQLITVPNIALFYKGGSLNVQLNHDGTYTTAQATVATPTEFKVKRINPGRGIGANAVGVKVSNILGSTFEGKVIELPGAVKSHRRIR